jgi:hypothetical protein
MGARRWLIIEEATWKILNSPPEEAREKSKWNAPATEAG